MPAVPAQTTYPLVVRVGVEAVVEVELVLFDVLGEVHLLSRGEQATRGERGNGLLT